MKTTGKVTGIVSNLVTVEVNGPVSQNELCYITVGDTKLMAEVIKVNGKNAAVQVFESTRGLPRSLAMQIHKSVSTPPHKDQNRQLNRTHVPTKRISFRLYIVTNPHLLYLNPFRLGSNSPLNSLRSHDAKFLTPLNTLRLHDAKSITPT